MAGLAGVALAEHRSDAALPACPRAPLTPGDAAALNGSGVALDQLGRHAEAQARYRDVLARDPRTGSPERPRLSLALDGRAAEAVPLLSALAEGPAAAPRNRQNLAFALALVGRDQDAVAAASADEAPERGAGGRGTAHRAAPGDAAGDRAPAASVSAPLAGPLPPRRRRREAPCRASLPP